MRIFPRRTVRLRLTAMYGALFLASAFVMLVIANSVGASVTSVGPVRAARNSGAAERTTAQELHAAVSHFYLLGSAIGLGVMAVVSVVLGWVLAGRMLRPLREMTAATQRISADSLHERLALSGPRDELKDLADTIDGLLERLDGAFDAQRRFVANAAHELRTPVATLRAAVDVAAGKPGPVPAQTIALADRLRAELGRIDELLDGLLILARAQHGQLPALAAISLKELADASVAAREAAIDARKLTIDSAGEPAVVRGNEALLARMVDNVIGNAIAHNADGGWITVRTLDDGRNALFEVENGGRRLDQRQVDELGQPFRRIGAERTGSDRGAGLGLSIVAAIAAAHGGSLELRARDEGGLRVSIWLPLAAGDSFAVPASDLTGVPS